MDTPTLQMGGWGHGHGCHEPASADPGFGADQSHATRALNHDSAPDTCRVFLLLAERSQTEGPPPLS